MRLQFSGYARSRGVTYQIARELGGSTIYVAERSEAIQIYYDTDALLLEDLWPEPGSKHVSNGRAHGAGTAFPKNIRDVIHSTGATAPPGDFRRTVRMEGRVSVRDVVYGIGKAHAGVKFHVIIDGPHIAFWHTRTGELVAEHHLPPAGVKIVGFAEYNMNSTPEPPTTPEASSMS